ncbi:MAG: site-2 protease family protein, partial [Myxococcota bacterium]
MQLGAQAVAAFIVFIGVLIFVHELGHFLAAKLFDIKVLKFSLGFGPPLISFRRGETSYQIAAVPLGGYVKMLGDNPHDDVDPREASRAFTRAPIYQRAIVAIAGPLFNFLFPVICFFAYNVVGPEVLAPEVGSVEPGQPAAKAGLQAGDRIVSVDGSRTWSFERLVELIQSRPRQTASLTVQRDGRSIDLQIVPDAREDRGPFGKRRQIGIIGVSSRRVGTRIGVVDATRAPRALATGDEVLRVGDRPVTDLVELKTALRSHAGKTVELEVSRQNGLQAGGLLTAQQTELLSAKIDIPVDFKDLASLGLAPSEL